MSLERTDYSVKIICDKCGHTSTADTAMYNAQFWEEGWALYPRAKKYQHKCRKCQSPKDRKAHDFVKEKFKP